MSKNSTSDGWRAKSRVWYGSCDRLKAKLYQQQIRDSLSDNPRQLASYIRKFPWTIEEAFYRDADLCPFNVLKLNEQLSVISFLIDPLYIARTPKKDGRWKIPKLFL